MLPRKAHQANVRTSRARCSPERSTRCFLSVRNRETRCIQRRPHTTHCLCRSFPGRTGPTGWSPDQPWPGLQAKESWESPQRLVGAASGVQVLNTRNPPNVVPGGFLFLTDPWVNSNHTLSPFCSSAMAKVVAVLPPFRSSVELTGV